MARKPDHGHRPHDRPGAASTPSTLGTDAAEDPDGGFSVDVDGFEGPLSLLLALARTHRVDLSQISMVTLADQYLAFIETAHARRLEVAADYLVMAAWLLFLKSKLLLPQPEAPSQEPTGEALARHLAFRLKRLEAMREVGAQFMSRPRLGQDVYARGMPEGVRVTRTSAYTADVYDLLQAYASHAATKARAKPHVVAQRTVMSIKAARTHLSDRLKRASGGWVQLDLFADHGVTADLTVSPAMRRSMVASAFSASLEMTREGETDLAQDRAFGPLFVRTRAARAGAGTGSQAA
ncbi:MAG: ScpA family protein [Pseudomonadota bacterium]